MSNNKQKNAFNNQGYRKWTMGDVAKTQSAALPEALAPLDEPGFLDELLEQELQKDLVIANIHEEAAAAVQQTTKQSDNGNMTSKKQDLSKKRLGRGLAALMGEPEWHDNTPASNFADLIANEAAPHSQNAESMLAKEGNVLLLEMAKIERNPQNPRQFFAEEELQELAQSIKEHGLLQPVLVRSINNGEIYQLIAGERRWRAAQLAGLSEIPALIHRVDDKKALELALIENVQRFDLNPIEEALGYKQLIEEYNYRQEDLAQILGKSRAHVTNILRLLKLPLAIQTLICEKKLTSGHARALINVENAEEIAQKIIEESLSVRQTEKLVQSLQNPEEAPLQEKAPQAATEAIAELAAQKQREDIPLEERLYAIEHAIGQRIEDNAQQIESGQHNEHGAAMADNSFAAGNICEWENYFKSFFALPLKLEHNRQKQKGVLKIHYGSLEELEQLYQRLYTRK